MVELEQRPAALLANIFRGQRHMWSPVLRGARKRVTHHAENILCQIRNGARAFSPELVSLILETVDAVKASCRDESRRITLAGSSMRISLRYRFAGLAPLTEQRAVVKPLSKARFRF